MIRPGHAALLTPDPDGEEPTRAWVGGDPSRSDPDPTQITVSGPTARGRPRGMEPVLGRYRLCQRLGAGGFGTVWMAWDERLEREVALKLLPRERIASGRFEREARAAARLNHPGIVVLYEAAVDDDGGYLVSELVRGKTLGRLLEDGRLSDRDIVRAAIALCEALAYAHRQGVVHRDVKPSNILMPDAPSTSAGVAKLTDFGVARLVGGDSLTRTGDIVGTTAYMAPEQAEGREADSSSDLYSLALVVYEALTGVNPVRLEGVASRSGRRLGMYLPAVRRHRRDLPRGLACAVDRALRPRQRERGTVPEFRAALQSAAHQVDDEPGVVAGPSPAPRSSAGWRPSQPPAHTLRASEPVPRSTPDAPSAEPARYAPRPRSSASARLTAAAAAAAATAWFAAGVLSPSPVLPAVAVLITALAVAILPRVGWLALLLTAAGLLIEQGSSAGALVLMAAALPTFALLLRHGTRWGLPASVPALALLGLAGLWPGLAGRAATAWERATLGATGWLWLVVGSYLAGQDGYIRLPAATPPPHVWTSSFYSTVHQVLDPLLYSGILVPAIVWGAGAVVLPWLTSSRLVRPGSGAWLTRGAILLAWAGTIALLTRGLLAALTPQASIRPGVAIVGAFACALAGGLRWPAALRRTLGHPQTSGRDSRSMETP